MLCEYYDIFSMVPDIASQRIRLEELQREAEKLAEERRIAREQAMEWTREVKMDSDDEKEKRPKKAKRTKVEHGSGDEGELSIAIPKEVLIRQSGHSAAGIVSEGECGVASQNPSKPRCGSAATPEPQTPGMSILAAAPLPEYAPIVVHISYSIKDPSDGVQFILPNDAYPYVRLSLNLVYSQLIRILANSACLHYPFIS